MNFMKLNIKKLFSVLVFVFTIALNTNASHIPGGNLTYQCTGNPNEYLLTMELFVKCPSTLSSSYSSFNFTISNDCGLPNPTVPTFTQVGVQQDVTQTCPSQLSNCPPNPSGGVQGVLMYTYEALITFPANCDSWEICFSLCCRDNATNVTGNSSNDMTFCTTINSQTQNCGGSPTVNAAPIPYVCAGQPVNFCLGASDPDGDSIYYSMVTPLDDGLPVTFTPPYTTNAPLQNFVLDPLTGCVTFNQSTIGNFVVAFLIESFDQNGNLTGSVIHDFQFIVINCSNVTPSPPTGGITLQPGSNAYSTGPNSIAICEGASACFDMTFTDNNPGDVLTIDTANSSILNNLPGATYTLNGTNPLTITVCWTVPPGSPSYINGTMTVIDGACPIVGSASQVIIIDVINSTVALKDTTICGNQSAQLTANGGQTFNWVSIAGDPIIVGTNFSCNPCANPIATPSQTTTYEVTSNLAGGCNNKDTVTVTVVPDFTMTVSQSSTTSCLFEPIQLNANVQPANPSYTYNWYPTNYLNNPAIANPEANITTPGTYTYYVDVTNPNGCTKKDSISITVTSAIAPDINILTPDSTIECDSTVLVDLDLGGGIPAVCGPSITNACSSPATQISVGTQTGQNSSTSYPAPYGNWYRNAKHQFLFTAAELNAMGFMGGKINEIAWQVTQINGTNLYNSFQISMKCTQTTNLTTWETGLTQVLNPVNHVVNVGWNTHPLDVAYEWDGTSNLVVEICYNNLATSFTNNSITPWTTTPFTSTIYYRSDATAACPYTGTPTTSTNRPITRFNWCPTTPDPNDFTFEWSPNIGINDSTLQNPTLSPTQPTTYTVTVTNINGGCIDTDTITITVQCCQIPQVATTDVTCFGGNDGKIVVTPYWLIGSEVQTITYTDSATNTVLQTTPNMTAGSDSLTNLPAGTYIISSTDTSGCTTDTTIYIYEPDQMFIDNITADDTICINGSKQISATSIGGTGVHTLTWTDNTTNTNIPGNGPHTVNPIVSPSCYEVFATDINGCLSDTQEVCISLFPEITGSTTQFTDTVCEGFTATLDASATGGSGVGYNFDWYEGGVLIGNGTTMNVTPSTSPTDYYVVITDNCTTPSDTIEYQVYWYDVPTLDIARNKPDSCYPITVEFSNTSIPNNLVGSTVWEFSDGSILNGNTVTNTFNSAGCRDLTVTVTTVNGCVLDTTIADYVCPKDYPNADFYADPDETNFLFPQISFINQSTGQGNLSYLWDFGTGVNPDSSTFTNPVHMFPAGVPGEYNVWLTVTNEHGCVDSTMRIVTITDIFLFYVPNSFTPDSDNLNDKFRAYGEGIDLTQFKMYIFDRWGELIYETDDIEDGWDGTYMGTDAPVGTYVWRIETKEKFVNRRHEMTGHVNLLR